MAFDEDAAIARILSDPVVVDAVRRMLRARRCLIEVRPILNASRPAVAPGSPEAEEVDALRRQQAEAEREEGQVPDELIHRLTELVRAEAHESS